ncbi:TrpA [Desulforapulum autotrophicum HRM2]|uniref:Tryptophan synthase alpha chain n=1 Tax=Desulforapulum autotrophicum (strain ATCC 43914 / DSM 3382 / VKM B-1955 / HRM2) TaxID=177437 RepID=TRPA_DESAH|nr:tryptophan synthase subunit alpha [Desulforapulum autotrophicum]C0QMA1.1 RecName: Full=Tryptophan synthase alpha chain [Desulforapulum autotrophicum HRM2]ACN16418.1 TrpA [Desulforapulum autotrophicum HRM2]
MLEAYIRERRRQKEILLMTHIVMGYPDFETSMAIVEQMVEAGVDLMELQIPFSEPMADGPVILGANQAALSGGARVERCFEFARQAAAKFDIPFLFMTYYNILFKYGVTPFVNKMADINIKGAIVPDLPPEEGQAYLKAMEEQNLSPIHIFSPRTSNERMDFLASQTRGFVYCVARKGVTGKETRFTEEIAGYLDRCRQATTLPLAVGFGVKDEADIAFLKGKADIAVVGSEMIRVVENQGVEGVGRFIQSLA